jgi:hypothetical protein
MKTRLSLSLLVLAPLVLAAQVDGPVPVASSAPERVQSSARDLGQLEFSGENDILSLHENDDKYYTNGFRVAYVTAATNSSDSVWDYRNHYGIGQELYTAKDRYATNPAATDHPYSAWLYGMLGSSWDDGESLDVITLRIGVVGPSAMGEQTQSNYHQKVMGIPKLNGWDTQLSDEPGINLEWRRNWRVRMAGSRTGFGSDFIPMLYSEVGTVRCTMATGAQVRFGNNLPADYGVSDNRKGGVDGAPVRYAPNGSLAPDSYYAYAGMIGELNFWDMALDGNMYHDSASVDSTLGVMQFNVGLVAHWGATRVAFVQTVRTREFSTQEGNFWYGGVTLTQAF